MQPHAPVPLQYDRTGPSGPPAWVTRLAVTLAAYPLLFLALLYGAWLGTWAEWGHRPHPATGEYPNAIAPVVLYNAARLLLMAAPVALLIAAACAAADLYPRVAAARRVRLLHIAAALAAGLPWAGAVLLLRWDPGWVWFWFID